MSRYCILAMINFLAGVGTTVAQTGTTSAPSPPPSLAPSNPQTIMEEPSPGDRWTYEVSDEILGTVKLTRTSVITEVTSTEITTRFSVLGNPNPGSAVFDRFWNSTSRGPWRYTPNDGMGVQLPLAVGKTWTFKSNDVNSTNGANWKRSGDSKVVARESVTTRAGTFDTFKIETSYSTRNINDPTKTSQITSQTWYAPSIDHWVKRTFISRTDGHLMENNTEVLVEYGRKH